MSALSRRTLLRAAGVSLGAAVTGGLLAEGVATAAPKVIIPSPRTATREGTVSVRDAGAVGDGTTDDTSAFRRALGSGAASVLVPAGSYRLTGELHVPWAVRSLTLAEGSLLRQHNAARHLLMRTGEAAGAVVTGVTGAVAGADKVRAPGHRLTIGSWVYLCSDDWYVANRYKPGVLRRVVDVAGPDVRLDKPVLRTMSTGTRLYPVSLAPALTVDGSGVLEQADPAASRANLVRADFAADLVLGGIELRNGGASGVVAMNTVGGSIEAWIHDMLDQPAGGHYGYGVEARSGTRGLRVGGRIERCRHAFTTNGAWNPLVKSMLNTGEPEDCHVAPVVRDTSSVGLDTHEPGWGITFVPDVQNAGTTAFGGVNIRARGTRVVGGSVRDSRDFGIAIQAGADSASISGTVVDGVRSGRGIVCSAPTTITDTRVAGFGGDAGLAVQAGTAVLTSGLQIDGRGVANSTGLLLRGSGGHYAGSVRGCSLGVREYPEARDNRVALDVADNVKGAVRNGA